MTITVASGNDQKGGIIGYLKSAGGTINKNVCKSSITPYGRYTGSTFTAHQVSNWNNDVTSYLSSVWTQNLGMNGGRPIFKSSLPDYDLVLTPASGLPNYNYENGVLTLLGGGTYTLTMKSGKTSTASQLVINNSAELTLNINNVNIDCSESENKAAICIGNTAEKVTMNLIGTSTLKSGMYCAGLQKENDMKLTIAGTGSISATGGIGGAGIGGGNGQNGYNVTVSGGAVTATGGTDGAGIGGGYNGSGGTIAINGGTVTANSGTNAAGIGGGYKGNGGDICVYGGTVTATAGSGGAGIGGGNGGAGGNITITGGTVTANGGTNAAGIGGGRYGSNGTFSTGTNGNAFIVASSISDQSYKTAETTSGVIVDGNNGMVYGNQTITTDCWLESGKTLTIPEGSNLTIENGVTFTNNGTIIMKGTLVNNGTVNGSGFVTDGDPVSYLDENGEPQECKIYKNLTADYLSENDTLTPGWYVVSGYFSVYKRITVNDSVHIILTDECNFSAIHGIAVADGKSLTIYAQSTGTKMGILNANASEAYVAGIGGGKFGNGGRVTINGGTVTAIGGSEGAGIGGGKSGNGGRVTINGGTVTAIGGSEGAGIGGGFWGNGGTITINGGTVTATGGDGGAGIGGGRNGNGGTFSTGENGNAYIVATSISDQSYKTNSATKGIIIDNGNGFVSGNQTLTKDFTLESGKTLTIPEGSNLTIENGVTFTNNGTVQLNGTLVLPSDTEANEALFTGFTGSGSIVINEKTYSANGVDMGALFANISASLGEDISLTYYIDKGDFATAPRMRFTINSYTMIVEGTEFDDGDGNPQYAYKFTGIAPQWMGDTITAELLDDNDNVIETLDYSVLLYLNKLKVEYPEAEYPALNQLINDLLVYGGAAQVFTNYNTEVLVSNGVIGSAFEQITEDDLDLQNNGTNATFTSAAVNFNNINRMKIYFTAEDTEGLTIKYKIGEREEQEIEYVSDGNRYVITTPGISASDFTNVFTFIAYKDDEAGATLTYSVKSYVYAKQNSTNTAMANLAKATYNYGKAAKAFVEAN